MQSSPPGALRRQIDAIRGTREIQLRFHQVYIRSTLPGEVNATGIASLASILVRRPVEILMSGVGAIIPPACPGNPRTRLEEGRSAAAALARRNIRSLLCRSGDIELVAAALAAALTAPPRDAEDALEDARLEMNLRYSLYATPDAAVAVEGCSLVVTDGSAMTIRLARPEIRDLGRSYFCAEARARLVSMDIDEVRFSPGAIIPLERQFEPGAVMPPDTAHQHLHKGGWRGIRKPDFIKDFCVACGRCFIHCPDNAIIHAAYDRNARDTTGILGIDTDRCTACGLCAAVCPANADGHKAIVMIAAEAESSPELHCVG